MKKTLVILTAILACSSLAGQSMSDDIRTISYTSMADAESKLMHYYQERVQKYPDGYDENFNPPMPYIMFTDLIINDSRAFDYDFAKFIGASENDERTKIPLRIVDSPDKKIRLYTWDQDYGSMSNYFGITSIKNGPTVLSYADHIEAADGSHMFPNIAAGAYDIDVVHERAGSPIYIVYEHSTSSSNCITMEASAYKIIGNKIERVSVFPCEERFEDRIYFDYSPSSNALTFEYAKGRLLIPETRENDMSIYAGGLFTGKSHSYRWNGTKFDYEGLVYDQIKDLHPVLLNYAYNQIQLNIGKWLIRIDMMPDGTYRYASWKAPKLTAQEPDLVIGNGHQEQKSIEGSSEKRYVYTFKNNGYSYIVSYDSFYGNIGNSQLIVKQNDNVIMSVAGK